MEEGDLQFLHSPQQHKMHKMRLNVKPDIIKLTHLSKQLYPLFSTYQLETNRFTNLHSFQTLASEIIHFNQELILWKSSQLAIPNFLLTYNLYDNLFARIKYVASFVLDRNKATQSYHQIISWFSQEKPKVRNKVPQKQESQIKPQTPIQHQNQHLQDLVQSNIIKRDMKVYETMARTAHTDFFPPKERIQEYKRKQLIQVRDDLVFHEKRASSMTNLAKKMTSTQRSSFATTRSTFKNTTNSFKSASAEVHAVDIKPFEIVEKKEEEEIDLINNEGKAMFESDKGDKVNFDADKHVIQEDLLKQNLIEVQNEEDQNEGEQQLLSEDEKVEKPIKKKYQEDPNADKDMIAEEKVKDAKQSTLRRIMNQKDDIIKNKLEDLDIKKHMLNWAAIKSKNLSEESRKMERHVLVNKYSDLEYIPKQTFNEKEKARKKDIPSFNMLYRSKSSHPSSIESEIDKMKISNALKTYGKYLNHVQIKPILPENQEQQQELQIMRATSLTSFCRQGKKKAFSSIFQRYGVDNYNIEAQQNLLQIKQTLAKKIIHVEKKTLYAALAVPNPKMFDQVDHKLIYPLKNNLLNNPFFPKNVAKKKKNR